MMHRRMNSFWWSCKLILLSLILGFGISERALAQYFPIHATVQWPAPQSPYLADYTTAGRDRLIVTLLNRDQQQPLLFAKLRLQLKSGGFTAKNREEVAYPMLELNTGVPIRLTSIDLSPYLQPQNLQSNGNLRNGLLPTGYAEISVQVIDYYTGRPLSDWHTARAYLDVKKPPFLNLPEQDAQVALRDPLLIRFQWTPRHQGLSGTEYEFVLKELPDNGVAPQSAFAYGQEIYRTHTRSTSLSYTHLDPLLFPNRRYAWQVRALAREGVNEVGMFEHGGYSEISWFTLNDQCDAPRGLKAQPRFAKVDLSWSKVIGTTGYIVECRPKTKLNVYEWAQTEVAGEQLTLAQLKPGWTYEWRVGTRCTGNRPVFSEVREFTLSKYNETLLADCGKEPVRSDLAQEPHLGIRAGDVVTIGGDYPMTITEVTPLGDGWYAGKGKTRLKTIIDAPIALRFDRLRINVDKYQIDGTVEASYDEGKGIIANTDYIDDGGKDLRPATLRIREQKLGFSLPESPRFFLKPPTNSSESGRFQLETQDAGGNPQTIQLELPEGADYKSIFPMTVTDAEGNSYRIQTEESGLQDDTATSQGQIALKAERVAQVGDFNADVLSKKYDQVRFERGQGKYAFDDGKEEWYQKSVKLDRFYKPFAKDYIAPWKLIPEGETDVVTARYEGKKSIDVSKLVFTSDAKSPALPASYDETSRTWSIKLPSVASGAAYDVFAVYEGEVLGKLHVVSYVKQQHKVTLVPINDATFDKAQIERELNTVYTPMGIDFDVEVDERMRGDYSWEVSSEQDKLLSLVGKSFWGYDKELKESTEMLRLQQAYQAKAGTLEGAYLFVLDGAKGLSSDTAFLQGEMPRKSRFGYIFAGNSPYTEEIVRTIAHELGHGLFTLQHTFDSEYAGKKSQKTSSNLMDYAKGTSLAAFQWNIMANPAIFTAMDKAEEAQSHDVVIKALLDWIRDNKSKPEVPYNKADYYKGFSFFNIPLDMNVVGGRKIQIYAELGSSGVVDFSVNEKNITNAISFDLDFKDKYHAGFTLLFSYARAIEDKEKAIKLWCYDYDSFVILLDYLGYKSIPQEVIVDLYRKALNRAGKDCDKLDIIYETAPNFVLDAIDDNVLLQHLNTLSSCDMSNRVMKTLIGWQFDTDEEKAVLNLISRIKDKKLLYHYLCTHPKVLIDLFNKVDGRDNRQLLLNNILQASTLYWQGASESIESQYKKENILHFSNGTQSYGRLIDTRVVLWSHTFSNSIIKQIVPLTPETSHELLDPIYILFTQENNTRNNQYSVVPAIYAYYLTEQQESERRRLALDWALTSTSVYGSAYSLLASTGKVARTIAWASLLNDATRLFFENSTLKAYIETQPWGEDFVKTYYALSLGIDITSIAHGCLLTVKENAYKVRKVLVENHVSEKELAKFDNIVKDVVILGPTKIPAKFQIRIPVSSYKVVPIENVLNSNLAKTFKDGYYYMIETTTKLTVYRRFGGNAKLLGSFVSTVPKLSRKELALLKKWNNMRFEAEIIVPQNTRLYVGRIEEQASYKGGADQILLPKDYPSEWIRTIRDLKTGKVYTFEEYMQITIK